MDYSTISFYFLYIHSPNLHIYPQQKKMKKLDYNAVMLIVLNINLGHMHI
jgi:hypothetical protein